MNVTQEGRAAMQNGADAMRGAKEQLKKGAAEVADRAQDVAGDAWRHTQRAGDRVSGFVHRRPVETALISAAAACLITGLAFWATRPD
jgi:ElaB/YqjD/DUF883 family membrane-anchored ribosome-binding protein